MNDNRARGTEVRGFCARSFVHGFSGNYFRSGAHVRVCTRRCVRVCVRVDKLFTFSWIADDYAAFFNLLFNKSRKQNERISTRRPALEFANCENVNCIDLGILLSEVLAINVTSPACMLMCVIHTI